MMKIVRNLLVAGSWVLLSGCTTTSDFVSFLEGGEKVSVPASPGAFNQVSRFLGEQLAQNRDHYNLSDNPIAVTSFVNIENYKVTNKIGETIADNMIHEMQVRGYKVIDFKSMPVIEVTDVGDFIRSRSVQELREKHDINFVLSGTYTNHENGMNINARMIELSTGLVISTAQAHVPKAIAVSILGNFNLDESHVARQDLRLPERPKPPEPKKRALLNHCFSNGVCIR